MKPMNNRSLYFGDNLEILREKFPSDEGYFDLIYLDPPFNSNRNYNVLFKEGLVDSEAQAHAFEDSWHWTHEAQAEFDHLVTNTNEAISNLMLALEKIVGHNDVLAYLTMMAVRLFELHRVLKPTGSIYLHCDPTASHYLKIVMDTVFGKENFRNEIVWKRHEGHSDAKRFASIHDIIFYYRKTKETVFNKVHVPYSSEQLSRYTPDETGRLYKCENLTAAGWSPNRSDEWRGVSPGANRHWMWSLEERERLLAEGKILLRQDGKPRKDGYKVYLEEMPGKVVGDVWTDMLRELPTPRQSV